MRKPLLLKSIKICVEACENLATACTQTDKHMYRDCLGVALDCADAGMMLSMKLQADSELHRNLMKQYITTCNACIAEAVKYPTVVQAQRALEMCKQSIEACNLYVAEHLHTDQYYFVPEAGIRSAYSQKQKQPVLH